VQPSKTLFVVNFDVQRVHERDLDRHFDYYGRINRIQIKKNYAFVQAGMGRGRGPGGP
jgi:arginine/serine-rich splicing factor 4/5/6